MKSAIIPRVVFLAILGSAIISPTLIRAGADPAKPAESPAGPLTPLEIKQIHNALQWSPNIISGSCPDGEAGYKALAARGVKTIITVDGARPDAALAAKYGLRYVHIPVEYSGIAHEDALKIIRAARDLPGPVFIHCHHGLHRGPAAAALVAITLAGFTNDQATAALKQAGTGLNYKGLWANVRDFAKPTGAELDKADNTFPAAAKQPSAVATMVAIDNRFDALKALKTAAWQPPATNPDLDPPHEALLLKEAFREFARTPAAAKYPADFQTLLTKAESASADLETALRANDKDKSAAAMDAIQTSCANCHKVYRDAPRTN